MEETFPRMFLFLDSVSLEFVAISRINHFGKATSQLTPMQSQATAIVRGCLSTMTSLCELRSMRESNLGFQVSSVLTGMVGRPRLEIPYEQLSFPIENRFSVPHVQIADMMGVSIRTIHRRMNEYGLSIHA